MTDATEISSGRSVGRPPRASDGLRASRETARDPVHEARTLKPGEFYGRDGEILSLKGDEYGDSLSIPGREIPDGWAYQWVRESVLGNSDKTYSNVLPAQANGWRAVPQARHPHTEVNQRGLVLCERPRPMHDYAQDLQVRKALEQKQIRDQQHGLKTTNDALAPVKSLTRVKTTIEAMPSDVARPKLDIVE